MAISSVTFILLFATIPCILSQNNTTQLDYRLSNIYQPSAYDIYLNYPESAFTAGESEYSGTVIIQFTVTETVSQIKLHASPLLEIIDVSLGGNTVISFSVENITEILTINVATALNPVNPYILTIPFRGSLRTADTTGLYKSSYQDNTGVTKYLVASQFQPTNARKAFPCFDEPSFKAAFTIMVDCPVGYTVRSNANTPTPSTTTIGTNIQRFTFTPTPLMSTYLLAIEVSEFTCTPGVTTSPDNINYAVCSRNEFIEARSWAVEIGPQLLTVLNNYTGINYNTSLTKLYQVAIPDFAADAMENWGLVMYREDLLLWDPVESSNSAKQSIATVMARKLAQQWFGNLVTSHWWSDLFLNEGLATYFEYLATHSVFPEWQLDKQLITNTLQRVLRRDSESSSPLQSEVSSPLEIKSKFNEISRLKGGSIFRMVEHMLGSNDFVTGLQAYLMANSSGNVIPQDLWRHLQNTTDIQSNPLPAPLDVIMGNWIHKSGFPLITARLQNQTVEITQSAFSIFSNSTGQWYVPISYTTSSDLNKFSSTLPSLWLSPSNSSANITLTNGNAWIILNNQVTGYYRVNYDAELWNRIRTALGAEDFGGITEIHRAQIVDDLFHLARIEKVTYSRVFHLIEFLANDTSYFSWTAAFEGFNFLLERVGRDSRLGQEITKHISRLMTNIYKSTPFGQMNDTDQVYTLKQGLALSWACALGNPDCIEVSRSFFVVYKVTGTRPNKNLRSIVYCNALRNSWNSRDWEFLWNQYLSATVATEKSTILSSLGCTRNETLLERYLEMTLRNDSEIRTQDRHDVFASVLNGNSIGVDIALRFLTNNHHRIAQTYPGINSIHKIIDAITEKIHTRNQTIQLTNFINTAGLSEEYRYTAAMAAGNNLQWIENFEKHLNEYYQIPSDNNTASTTTGRPIPAGSANVEVNMYSLVIVTFFSYYVLK